MSETKIKTSVIIPIYNTEEYLDQCIQSVLNQTQKEIEIILVDDGSTDNSSKLIRKYEEKYANIFAIYQTNQKQGAARNAGLKQANGKYVYFLDSDDSLENNLLEDCYLLAESENADFVFFDAESYLDDDSVERENYKNCYDRSKIGIPDYVMSGTQYWENYYLKGGIFSSAVLVYVRRDFLVSNKIVFENGIFYEDYEWILKLHLEADRICYISQKLYRRRFRKGSTTTIEYSNVHIMSRFKIVEDLINLYCIQTSSCRQKMVLKSLYEMIGVCEQSVREIKADNRLNEMSDIISSCLKKLICREKDVMSIGQEFYMLFLNKICKMSVMLETADSLELAECEKKYSQIINAEIRKKYRLEEYINIGIYGIGQKCQEIFDWYDKNGITINARIKFILSAPTMSMYMNYPVYGVEQINDGDFDFIIVASTKYKDEMISILEEKGIPSDKVFVTYTHFPN